jgi:transcription termination factor NusB
MAAGEIAQQEASEEVVENAVGALADRYVKEDASGEFVDGVADACLKNLSDEELRELAAQIDED